MFNAIFLSKEGDQFRAELRELDYKELEANTPGAEVTLAIDHSTINYKDGLALTNKSPVVRKWPLVPGIDCAGTVIEFVARLERGDVVVLSGGSASHSGAACCAAAGRDWLSAFPFSPRHGDRHCRIYGLACSAWTRSHRR
jgi:acrylyl-CoA reductase (NADPH)